MALGMWLRNRNCMKPTAETMMPKDLLHAIWRTSAFLSECRRQTGQPLRKPVAMHDRNAIHFRNAQTPANRDAASLLHKRIFPQRHDTGHREAISGYADHPPLASRGARIRVL